MSMRWAGLMGLAAALFLMARGARAGEDPKPIRVLVTHGGHDFQEKEFWAMWDDLPGIDYHKARLPEEADLLRPGLEKDYDVIVCYDMSGGLTEAQKRDFLALLDQGIGLVCLHHNLAAHRDWPEYARVRGGKWVFEEETIDGKAYPPSTFDHDQEIPISPSGGDHVITRGLDDFVIHDETYGGIYASPQVRVILKAHHPRALEPFAWVNSYGKSRVVTYLAGHDAQAWVNPTFREILRRSIAWTAHGEGGR